MLSKLHHTMASSSTELCADTSDEQATVNFNRICCLLMREGTKCIANAVKDHLFPGQRTLQAALKANKQRFDKLKSKGIVKEDQYQILYPDGIQFSEDLIDMSLWFILAKNITKDNGDPRIKWFGDPKWNDGMWQHNVIRIKNMRNKLFHLNCPQLDDDQFNKLKTHATNALKNLGVDNGEIQVYFTRDLDPETTRQCLRQLQNQVADEMFQIALVTAKEKKQINVLISLVVGLIVIVGIGAPLMVVYLKPKPPCSASLVRLSSENGVVNFMPRKGWGALPALRTDKEPMVKLQLPLSIAGVFHTAIVQTDCHVTEDCCEVVRYVQKAHMEGGWQDIAYNYLIADDGVIYEGRGANKQGAAVKYRNSEVISIAMLGNFMCQPPGRTGLVGLYVFLDHLCHLNPEDKAISFDPVLTQNYSLMGHCQLNVFTPDHNKTFPDSPGAALMKEIMNWDHWNATNVGNCTIDKDCLKPSQCCKPCT